MHTEHRKYDAIIIGAGQGGGPLSHRFADLGWTVALIEEHYLGATCINPGCTPAKTMVAGAQVAHYARNAVRWGIRTSEVAVDLAAIVARKEQVVQSFRAGQQGRVDARPNLLATKPRRDSSAAIPFRLETQSSRAT